MTSVKQPHWDKQDGLPIIIANPTGPNKNPSLTEPLRVGQEATATIQGIEVVVVLTDVLTPTRAHGEIVRILDGYVDRETFGDLSIGDTVLIRREDMFSLNIDTESDSSPV